MTRLLGIYCLLFVALALSSFCFAQETANPSSSQSSVELQQAQSSSLSEGIKKRNSWTKRALSEEDVPDLAPSAGRMGKGLLYTLTVLIVIFAIVKKVYGNKFADVSNESIKVISKRQIGARSCLFVVKAEEQKFLLAQSGDDITLLSELDALGQATSEQIEFESDTEKGA